jgi:outer membrane protein assembly factor BamB
MTNPGSAIVADGDMVIVGDSPAAFQPYTGFEKGGISVDLQLSFVGNRGGFTLVAFRLADGVQKWRYATGGLLVGAPQIAYGRVYAVTWQPPTTGDATQSSIVYCLNEADGTLVWKYSFRDDLVGALSVADGVVVVPGPFHGLSKAFGLDADSGRLLWTANLPEDDHFKSIFSPAIADGRTFLYEYRHLYAFDLQTGQQLWRSNTGTGGQNDLDIIGEFLGPVVAADGRIFFADQASVYALDAASGRILWRYKPPSYTFSSGVSYDPIQGLLYITGSWDGISTTPPNYEGIVALAASTGTEVWKKANFGQFDHPAIIANNGRILVQGGVLDGGSGLALWQGGPLHPSALSWASRGYEDDLPREKWLPDDWVQDAAGESVLLSSFNIWEGQPALSRGFVIGWADRFEPETHMQLVAFGADTTPPDVSFNRQGDWLERWQSPLGYLSGTAYDYNLKEWSLLLRGDQQQAAWQILRTETTSIQNSHLLYQAHDIDRKKMADGVWTLRLVATDTTGLSSSDELTFVVDNTPPTVLITAPENGTVIKTSTFTLTGTAFDTNGIAHIDIYDSEGGHFTLPSITQPWTLPMAVSQLMAGKTITYYAKVTDTFGNVGKSNSVTLTFPRFEVKLEAAGRRLVGSLPMFVARAGDIDGDGIDQYWENEIIKLTMPIVELDEGEDWLVKERPDYTMNYFVRVTGYTPPSLVQDPAAAYPPYILVYIVFGWPFDFGAVDFTIEAHRGDSETVVMAWKVINETTAELDWVRTSSHNAINRHHGLWNAWQRSCTYANVAADEDNTGDTEMMCASLEFDTNGRLVLYPGEDKHAIYPTTDVCNAVKLLTIGYGEDCGWNPKTVNGQLAPGQWKDSDFSKDPRYKGHGRWLFDAYNVGEPDPCHLYQLIDFLDKPDDWRGLTPAQTDALNGLYPNEAVWSGTAGKQAQWDSSRVCTLAAGNDGGDDFCGGLGVIAYPNPKERTLTISKCSTKLGSALGQAGNWTDKGPPDLISDALNARYQVTIKTGDMDRAGTDATITMGLSHNGAAIPGTALVNVRSIAGFVNSNAKAPYFFVGSFERGDIDNIYLPDKNAGEVTGIYLSQNGTGNGPGWFVEEVLVKDLVNGKVWAAWPETWLATDMAPNTTSRFVKLTQYQPGSVSQIDYQVIVTTGDLSGAGTDGDVSITLTGEDGTTSGSLKLDNGNSNDFERASLGNYTVSSRDLGELTRLRVDLKKVGDNAEWMCQEVTVRNPITGQVWVFPIEAWLGRGNGPLMVEMPPGN